MADSTEQKKTSSPPEVQLGWSDFMWSLEKLRHKPYSKKMRERDWFSINPLEMILLGFQSLLADDPAKRDHGTMVLVMPSLRPEMSVRPRYWRRLLAVLCATIQGEETPTAILQRCCLSLISLWKVLGSYPEFQPGVYAWCISELKIAQVLRQVLDNREKSLTTVHCMDLKKIIEEIDDLVTAPSDYFQSQKCFSDGGQLDQLLWSRLKEYSTEDKPQLQLCIQLYMMSKKDSDGRWNFSSDDHFQSFTDIIEIILKSSCDASRALSNLFSIIHLLPIRADVLLGGDHTMDDINSKISKLFESLLSSLQKWEEMVACIHKDSSKLAPSVDVPHKLLSLAEVMLAYKPLTESVPEVTDFFLHPVSSLMIYSTEGYLSDSPHEFLAEMLEFVSSLVERGTPAITALQVNLPNLFGPAFGVHDHAISCKLLEFGYLSVCSQHKKSLLTEGLKFLMSVFHLFRPIDELRAQEKAVKLRTEALNISRSLLEELIESIACGTDSQLVETKDKSSEMAVLNETESELEKEAQTLKESIQIDSLPIDSSPSELDRELEREMDREARLKVLLRLFQLACVMIRNGENISFLFASCLPKLFKQPSPDKVEEEKFNKSKLQKFFGEEPPPPASSIPWKLDKKKFAIQLLDLTVLSVENDVISPFQLCGIVAPKMIKNLDKMLFSDEEKMSLCLDILKLTQDTLEAGHNIDHLTSYGIDLLSQLLPNSATSEELRQFTRQMASHFVNSTQSYILFLVKNACTFMINSFPDEVDDIRPFFKALLFKGKRDEIRGVFKVCKPQLKDDQYLELRLSLYKYSSGRFSRKQLLALCELIITAMDIAKPHQILREVVTNVEEEDTAETKEKKEAEMAVLVRLISPSMAELKVVLEENRFRKEVWEQISSQLSQIALFRTLFQSDFAAYVDLTKEELLESFRSKFPADVISSEDMMQLLALSATRIEHMQVPRYDSLKMVLSNILRHFLTLQPQERVTEDSQDKSMEDEDSQDKSMEDDREATSAEITSGSTETTSFVSGQLDWRMAELESYLDALNRNSEDRLRLMECGYSHSLWEKEHGSLSLEENMRQNLLACYSEFADILKQMAITHVSVDGEMIKSDELFLDELSLTDLKGRRAIAVRVIDQKRGGSTEGHFNERKAALLAKEDQIEAEFDKMAKVAIKPKTFRVTVSTKFFDCARCCGAQIIGCYAPTGEHCERPLEIGLRNDSAIASVYDELGVEIENVEMLFTEEGVYVFKAYSNGHPYDTSQVWTSLFTAMLKDEAAVLSLVPAVIIPKGYPNQRTWETLRRTVSTEVTGSILTCRHDFSPEWRTYYDHRPERVRLGVDMVLHPGFSLSTDQSRPVLQRQRSKFTKDLAGIIFEEVMQDLLADDWLKQFRFLGKVISQYISVCINEGQGDAGVFMQGFDYERWRKTASKTKKQPAVPHSLVKPDSCESTDLPSKEDIVDHLVSFLDRGIIQWCSDVELPQLCASNHKQLLELKRFLEKATGSFSQLKEELLNRTRELLMHCTFVVPILALPDSLQEEIIHWVFRNEDRVWRYRGGRDGRETLQQFMTFLGKTEVASSQLHLSTAASALGVSGQKNSSAQSQEVVSVQRVSQADVTEVYAGVAVFCVPHVAETGREIDYNTFQVRQMTAYAVGEVLSPDSIAEEDEDSGSQTEDEEEDQGTVTIRSSNARWYPGRNDQCYEIVTAWVHPSYRGLNLSVQMYLMIISQAPARLVMFDMLEGSIERIVNSNWILQLLRRIKMWNMVIQKQEKSYTVVTQTGATEQFEQVLINARTLRVALTLYNAAKWIKSKFSIGTVAMVTIPGVMLFSYSTIRLWRF